MKINLTLTDVHGTDYIIVDKDISMNYDRSSFRRITAELLLGLFKECSREDPFIVFNNAHVASFTRNNSNKCEHTLDLFADDDLNNDIANRKLTRQKIISSLEELLKDDRYENHRHKLGASISYYPPHFCHYRNEKICSHIINNKDNEIRDGLNILIDLLLKH